ncbi:hypothetical protein [Pyrobaculum sp.]|uniref:hypothetical protein n=1 Tax=Pyrobaculum sp. TaxID=2004705 RepID=UPI003D099143
MRVKGLYYYVEVPTHYFLFGNPRVDWEFADAYTTNIRNELSIYDFAFTVRMWNSSCRGGRGGVRDLSVSYYSEYRIYTCEMRDKIEHCVELTSPNLVEAEARVAILERGGVWLCNPSSLSRVASSLVL